MILKERLAGKQKSWRSSRNILCYSCNQQRNFTKKEVCKSKTVDSDENSLEIQQHSHTQGRDWPVKITAKLPGALAIKEGYTWTKTDLLFVACEDFESAA